MPENKDLVKLTQQALQRLQREGFEYVLIKGYSVHKKLDYMELNSFRLTPVKALPTDPAQKEIYAPLDSEILLQWAGMGSEVEAFIEIPASSNPLH